MPFTVSHTAAVLPFQRWLGRVRILPAAIIGSMAPDFGLFLPFWIPRYETHGRMALLTFCLPLGLASWALFEALLRPALQELAPDRWWSWWHRRGAADLRAWRTWLLAAAAVVGGAVTHLVWDGFTHEGARGVEMLPALEADSLNVVGHPMRLYRLLQHFSSLAGLAIVAWVIWRWHRALPPAELVAPRPLGRAERTLWIVTGLAIPLATATTFAIRGLQGLGRTHDLGDWVVFIVEAGMVSTAVTWVVISVLLQWRLRGRGA